MGIELSQLRLFDVTKYIGGLYRLEPLSLVDSQKLFNLEVFGAVDNYGARELDVGTVTP